MFTSDDLEVAVRNHLRDAVHQVHWDHRLDVHHSYHHDRRTHRGRHSHRSHDQASNPHEGARRCTHRRAFPCHHDHHVLYPSRKRWAFHRSMLRGVKG